MGGPPKCSSPARANFLLLSICLGLFVTMKSNVNFKETGLTINVNRKP